MAKVLVQALFFWLNMWELVAAGSGWNGLSWRHGRWARLLDGPLLVGALHGRGRGARWAVALVVMALPALLVQIALSSARHPLLDPLLHLRPADYPRYRVSRFDIPLTEGWLPALLIEPVSGARAAVCVLHGSGCDKTSYIWRIVERLVRRDVALLLVDRDGHGENPRPQRFPEITEDAAAAVAWLRERYARVGLLGISLGGCVAARAVADGVAVDALALLEAPPVLEFSKADIRREAVALVRPDLLDLFADCTPYNLYRGWNTAPIRAAISTWDLIAALDVRGSLERIHVPLLLLYGARDAIVKPRQAEQVRQAAPRGARFRLVPRASHLTLVLTPAALAEVEAWAQRLAE